MSLPPVEVSQSPEEKFREYLSSRPKVLRYTEQRRDLVRYIFAQHNHFDAEQLIRDIEKAGLEISRATVYRTLNQLVDAGMLRTLEIGPRKVYDHDYGYPMHEHLVCQQCGKMIEFQDPAVEALIQAVCSQYGFQSTGHTFIVRGTCTECNRARVTKRRLDLV